MANKNYNSTYKYDTWKKFVPFLNSANMYIIILFLCHKPHYQYKQVYPLLITLEITQQT